MSTVFVLLYVAVMPGILLVNGLISGRIGGQLVF
jgi:hypothetical protein